MVQETALIVYIPDQNRPPPELMAGGYNVEDTDDENSASDSKDMRYDGFTRLLVSAM